MVAMQSNQAIGIITHKRIDHVQKLESALVDPDRKTEAEEKKDNICQSIGIVRDSIINCRDSVEEDCGHHGKPEGCLFRNPINKPTEWGTCFVAELPTLLLAHIQLGLQKFHIDFHSFHMLCQSINIVQVVDVTHGGKVVPAVAVTYG